MRIDMPSVFNERNMISSPNLEERSQARGTSWRCRSSHQSTKRCSHRSKRSRRCKHRTEGNSRPRRQVTLRSGSWHGREFLLIQFSFIIQLFISFQLFYFAKTIINESRVIISYVLDFLCWFSEMTWKLNKPQNPRYYKYDTYC